MPIDPNDALQAMERSLGMVPGVVVVIVLLGGPTILWLLYQFIVQPRSSRYGEGSSELLWVCRDCRSVNEARHSRCYGCGLSRDAITGALQVFDGDGLVTLEGDDGWDDGWDDAPFDDDPFAPLIAPLDVPATALGARPTLPPPEPPPVVPSRPRRLVAVGPGRPRSAPSTSPIPSATADTPDAQPADAAPATPPPSATPSPSRRAPRRRSPVAAGAAHPPSADPTADPPAGA